MQILWTDLRVTVRRLVRTPGYSLTAIAVLALGIGANTAMFSLLHSVLLSPLPYAAPQSLVGFEAVNRPRGISQASLSVEIDPDHLPGYIGLSRYYQSAPAIAGGSMEKAIELDPKRESAQQALATLPAS